ncbi:MAG: esterase-like activity of phytase family protein [Candidatus Kapabacteria bacterium]|nr:esterase-like activity of phytase family protein [Candidatus Kapabacteria bacterium]
MKHSVLRRTLLITLILCGALQLTAQQQGRVMQFLGRFSTNAYNQGSAETVAYDPATQRLFLTGALNSRLTALDIRNPAAPIRLFEIALAQYGGVVNSVASRNGIVAVALEDAVPQNPGKVVFFNTDGTYLNMVTVGALPDMICFSPDGTRVLTANEGEPSTDYLNDPEGSVSIISLANGVANATVRTATFTQFNTQRDSLIALGVRITGANNPTVAQDLEPEYIAFGNNGATAYVTLQEANAVAVLDVNNATFTEIQPLGMKDYRRGLPRVQTFPFNQRPLLGTTTAGQQIFLGGFSGLAYEGVAANGNWRFITVTDRGPNAAPTTINGVPTRPFALPAFQPRCIRFELNPQTGVSTITQTILLTRNGGTTPLTGLPNLQASTANLAYTDEIPVNPDGTRLANDPFGGDLEGIAVAANGELWMCDEYRPAIYRFSPTGDMVRRYIPQGTAASVNAAPGAFGMEALPSVYASRRPNRGFEAIAIEGTKVYAFIQSPLDNPNNGSNSTSKASSIIRIVEFDIPTETVTGEYLMPLYEARSADELSKVDKIGDAVSLGNRRFMVVVRDSRTGTSAKKLVFEVDLATATNLITNPPQLGVGATPENLGFVALAQRGVRCAYVRRVCNLASLGYGVDKVEGLALINPNTFVAINDNDFGMMDAPLPMNGTVRLASDGGPISVAVLRFDQPNAIDVSDRDGAGNTASINFKNFNVPVFGLFQPDAIATYQAGGQTFYVTANEGDVREYGSFLETRRVNDATLLLDPTVFPASANVRADNQLGRINVFRTTGDIDGDGDLDEIHTQGGRSFTIWSSSGTLVYDSGEDFDRITSQLFPANFNCSNTNNTFDNRSTSKGTEPEGIAISTIGDSTYAFICLERIGGVMMYNITNPFAPRFVDYLNSRNFAQTPALNAGGDLGPEVVMVIPAAQSPNGQHLIVCANEISGTVSLYGIQNTAITEQPQTQSVCAGETVTLRTVATGPSLTYQWLKDGQPMINQTQNTLTLESVGSQSTGIFECIITPAAGTAQPLRTRTALVAVLPQSQITSEPQNRVATVGSTITLATETNVTDNSLRYQWFRGFSALQDGGRISGSRSAELRMTNLQQSDAGNNYYCQITSRCGIISTRRVTVDVAAITIRSTAQAVRVCESSPAVLRVDAQATVQSAVLEYEWRKGTTVIPQQTSSSLSLPSVRAADTGSYFVRITLAGTSSSVMYGPIPVQFAAPTSIEQQPQAGILCTGTQSTLRVEARGESLRYQWQRDGTDVPGATQSQATLTEAGRYTVTVTGTCGAQTSNAAVLTLRRPPVIREQPREVVSLTEGKELVISVGVEGDDVEYQWFKNGVAVQGATSNVFRSAASMEARGRYRCRISNQCGTINSSESSVDVITSVAIEESGLRIGSASPNPASTATVISLTSDSERMVTMTVYDNLGRVVLRREVLCNTGVNDVRITTSGELFTTGAYTAVFGIGAAHHSVPFAVVR